MKIGAEPFAIFGLLDVISCAMHFRMQIPDQKHATPILKGICNTQAGRVSTPARWSNKCPFTLLRFLRKPVTGSLFLNIGDSRPGVAFMGQSSIWAPHDQKQILLEWVAALTVGTKLYFVRFSHAHKCPFSYSGLPPPFLSLEPDFSKLLIPPPAPRTGQAPPRGRAPARRLAEAPGAGGLHQVPVVLRGRGRRGEEEGPVHPHRFAARAAQVQHLIEVL